MNNRFISAAKIAVTSIVIYPLMQFIAYLEHGRQAFGGEDVLLIAGLLAAVMLVIDGLQMRVATPETTEKGDCEAVTFSTESEQSDEHYRLDA